MKNFWSNELFRRITDETIREIAMSAAEELGDETPCSFAVRLCHGGASIFDGMAEDEMIDESIEGLAMMSAQMAVEQLTRASTPRNYGLEMRATVLGNTLITYVRRRDMELGEGEEYALILSVVAVSSKGELWDYDLSFRVALDKAEDLLRKAYEAATDDNESSIEAVLKEMSVVLNLVSSDLDRVDLATIEEALKAFREKIATATENGTDV